MNLQALEKTYTTKLKHYPMLVCEQDALALRVATAMKAKSGPVSDDGSDDGRSDGVSTETPNGSDEVPTEISNKADGNRGTRAYSRICSGGGNNDSSHMGSKDTGNGRDFRSSRQRSSRNWRNHPRLRPLPRAIAGGRDFAKNAP